MTSSVALDLKPYVGPNPLPFGQRIFGRDREIADLRDQLIAGRIVLLYSPSGAGKSSLLEAGLRPELAARQFNVLPTVRVGHDVGPASANRYIASTLQSLEEGHPTGERIDLSDLLSMGLERYLERIAIHDRNSRRDGDRPVRPCLFFDQFEELFTADPIDLKQKAEFLEILGNALADRTRWAVFSMREDFIAQLDPFLESIPTRFAARYRLDLLEEVPARAAAQQPAIDHGVGFDDDAATRLVNNLRTVRVRRGDSFSNEPGPYVEPVVLQVVCGRLWDALVKDDTRADQRIRLDDVTSLGNVDGALADFCDQQVQHASEVSGESEVVIREWIETELISDSGFRNQVLSGPGANEAAVLASLDSGHFLRPEWRRGTKWYEIAHDRLTLPVVTSNARWRSTHLTDVQLQAKEWADRERPAALLLRDDILDEANAWARRNPSDMRRVDEEYLEASEAERQRVLAAKHRQRRDRLIALAACAFAIAALAAFVLALRSRSEAQEARAAAELAEAEAEAERVGAEAARVDAEQTASELATTQRQMAELQTEADRAKEEAERLASEAEQQDADPAAQADAERAALEASVAEAQLLRAEADQAVALAKVASNQAATALSEASADSGGSQAADAAEAARDGYIAARNAADEAEQEAVQAELRSLSFGDQGTAGLEEEALDELERTRGDDEAIVSDLIGGWVPQISSKKAGVPDQTWDYARINDFHSQLATEYGALLFYSADFISYSDPTFWISVAPVSFETDALALDWCVQQGIDRGNCFAKLISRDALPDGSVSYQA